MNEQIQRIVNNDKIPSPPAVAARLLDLLSQAEPDANEVTSTLAVDPTLSAKLIKYCNSPVVGARREISSIKQAIVVMGMRTTRLLSLSFSIMDTKNDSAFDYQRFWRQSLATAIAAKTLYKRVGLNGDEGLLLGLVLNVGQVGIANTCPELMPADCDDEMMAVGMSIQQEMEALNANRYQIGGMMLKKWNFPDEMVNAVTAYNPEQATADNEKLLLSQKLGELLLASEPTPDAIREIREFSFNSFGVTEDGFNELFDSLIAEWKDYESIFSYENIKYESLEDIEKQARESMLQISLGLEIEIEQSETAREQLQKTAMVDSLTTLKNRRAYDLELPEIVSMAQEKNASLGVIVIDIDHFKSFNDTHGHATGDTVLKEVGKCLACNIRGNDSVYRYGGEEFVVLLKDCQYEQLSSIADRLRMAVEAMCIDSLKVTASLGGSWSSQPQIEKVESLFEAADKNLYVAKENGRNRCVVDRFDDGMPSDVIGAPRCGSPVKAHGANSSV